MQPQNIHFFVSCPFGSYLLYIFLQSQAEMQTAEQANLSSRSTYRDYHHRLKNNYSISIFIN